MKKLLVSFVFVLLIAFTFPTEASAQIEYGCYWEWIGTSGSDCWAEFQDGPQTEGSGYFYTWYDYQSAGGYIYFGYGTDLDIKIVGVSSYNAIAVEAWVWHPSEGWWMIAEAYIEFDHNGLTNSFGLGYWSHPVCSQYGLACGYFMYNF